MFFGEKITHFSFFSKNVPIRDLYVKINNAIEQEERTSKMANRENETGGKENPMNFHHNAALGVAILDDDEEEDEDEEDEDDDDDDDDDDDLEDDENDDDDDDDEDDDDNGAGMVDESDNDNGSRRERGAEICGAGNTDGGSPSRSENPSRRRNEE